MEVDAAEIVREEKDDCWAWMQCQLEALRLRQPTG
jgi:hypothetical protein